MNRIKEFFNTADFFAVVLVFLGFRACIVDFSIGQAVAIACFTGGYCFKKWVEHQAKPDLSEDVKKELTEVRAIVSGLAMKNAAKPALMKQELDNNRRFF